MKVLNGIELIDLAIYTNKTLILTDFHIGYEEALNKQGLMVPRFQFQEIMERLEKIFSRLKNKSVERIIVNGDLKHEFGTISDQEWRHTLKLLDYFGQHCNEIILIKGNHDTILGPIANKRNVHLLEHYLINPSTMERNTINKENIEKTKNTIKKISINNKSQFKNKKMINKKKKSKNKILVIHGDKIPDKGLLKDVKTIIIGHEHPAVSIKEGPRAELFKAFLIGKWKKCNLIVQPSFNLVVEGTDVLKEGVLSPFLKNNLRNFNAIVVADKLYNFVELKRL
ncbi:metallophosphoesterase [Candidatus Woesearchaeota archaeon]|nr:metallophosphoesterase [Candidatus Woesearchaeota archaeon]